jgi:CubicO group peptidase (beta-lactamase class C family)
LPRSATASASRETFSASLPSQPLATIIDDMRPYLFLLSLFLALNAVPSNSQTTPPRITGDVVPAAEWERTSPESVGFSSSKLEAVRVWLKTQDTGSMVIVVQGRIIFAYGDLTHTSKVASVRKSVLGMLYGKYVLNNKIDPDKTVKQIGLDDKTPFLPIEEKATLIQLLASRSGIYLPGGNAHPENLSPWDQARYMPPRGSEYPGSYYVYNNWDFNAAGTAFEKLTGTGIYQALQTDLAAPLGLQDYDVSKQKKIEAPGSVHPEYAMYLSTRDMARLGLLMLDSGTWNGKEIVPGDWVRYMTTLITPFRDINPSGLRNYGEPARWGYGLLWWVWDQPFYPGNTWNGFLQGAYTAAGSGGTYITVLPGMDMVVVHQVDIDKNTHASVSPSSYIAILSMIGNAQCDTTCN